MSRLLLTPALAGLLILASTSPARTDDTRDDDIAEMRALVHQLKSQVDAQAEQLEHQGRLLHDAQERVAAHEEEAMSGLAPFLSSIEVDGWVAGSYFWNFNRPGAGQVGGYGSSGTLANQGASGNFYPFHGGYDSFNVDQVWFGVGKPATEESRAGFRFDIVYGNTACFLGASAGLRCPGDNTSQLYVNQAYIEYLAPIFRGVDIKAGRFGTLLGAEVAQTVDNFNITRGNVYNLLQPIDHMGVLASTDLGAGFSFAVGGVNGFGTDDPDINLPKSLLTQIKWASETFSSGITLIWGPEQGPLNPAIPPPPGDTGMTAGNPTGVLDVLLTWDPTEKFSSWINFDYGWGNGITTPANSGWGLAVAGRYAILESTGVSLRFEYLEDDGGYFGFTAVPPDVLAGAPTDARIFDLTGTIDYSILENLMVRGEVRWDTIKKFTAQDREFIDRGNKFAENQVTAGVELIYTF